MAEYAPRKVVPRGDESEFPLVDQERKKQQQEGPRSTLDLQEVKGKNDALNLFSKRIDGWPSRVRLRRASTPLTEDFEVTNRCSHSIDIRRGKKGYVETMIYLDDSNQIRLLCNHIWLLKRKEK